MQEMLRLKEGLPHLFGFPWYKWAKEIFESTENEILLTSANQCSKSSTAIRKNIHWATSPAEWRKIWPNLMPGQKPGLFWYFYPTHATATTEVENKWVKEFLPRGDFKNHPVYGWKANYSKKGEIHSIEFNTEIEIQFKSYSQKIKDLQSSSVYLLTADEEMPVEFLPELMARLNATSGKFMSIFTATLGQDHWRRAMEPVNGEEETHKTALKKTISLYDCRFYEDGTPSPWTDEKIKRAIANCPTEAEVQRRIYGRFVKAHGLKYESFSLEHNMCDPFTIPDDWLWYSAIDPGSGGQSGHPTGIIFIAVSPDHKRGVVAKAWRGDKIPTDNTYVLNKHKEMRGDLTIAIQSYDYANKDFFNTACSVNETFVKADKARNAGAGLLNTLFKTRKLKLFRNDPEIGKLVQELMSLPMEIDKRVAQDDLIDPARYAAMSVQWDMSDVEFFETDDAKVKKIPQPLLTPSQQRRQWFLSGEGKKQDQTIEDELAYWNEMMSES